MKIRTPARENRKVNYCYKFKKQALECTPGQKNSYQCFEITRNIYLQKDQDQRVTKN